MPMDIDVQVRLVRQFTTDTHPKVRLFSDADVQDALALNTGAGIPPGAAVRYAAADLLEMAAVSEVLVSKKIRTQDLSTDGPAVSAELRALAKRLRDAADKLTTPVEDQASFIHVVPGGGTRGRLEAEEYRWH